MIAITEVMVAIETTVSWDLAMQNTKTPSGLILSRQNITTIPAQKTSRYNEALETRKGGYLVKKIDNPDITLIANGSEVNLLLESANVLEKEKNLRINVASIPSEGLFKSQSESYQLSIIPKEKPTFGLTAGLTLNLEGLVGNKGKVMGLNRFGDSAPAAVLDEKFGFTSQNVVQEILKYIEEIK